MDAEFLAQTFCLERGWREPNTLNALVRAGAEGVLAPEAARSLVQPPAATRGRDSATLELRGGAGLPDDPAPQYRVAVRCGFATTADFLDAVARYRREIRAVYQPSSAGAAGPPCAVKPRPPRRAMLTRPAAGLEWGEHTL